MTLKSKIQLSAVMALLLLIGVGLLMTPKAEQIRANSALDLFLQENNVQAVRRSCSYDSDGDGYSSCSAKASTGEDILLQCTSSIMSAIPIIGARACKEQGNNVLKLR